MIYTVTLNPAIDRLLFLEGPLLKKKTNRIKRVAFDLGGKGLHGSHVLTTLGVANQALGFIGSRNCKTFLSLVATKGIEHQFISLKDQATRECFIILEEGVRGSSMLTEPGFRPTEAAIEALLLLIKQHVKANDLVLIAGSLPAGYTLTHFAELLRVLKRQGCFIACDLSGPALNLAVDAAVNMIKPNEFELAELTSKQVGEDVASQVKELNETIEYVIASQGKRGSLCAYRGALYQVTAPVVTEVNDTGAGDCFVGAFIAGLARQESLVDNLIFATACAASKVQHEDSTTFSHTEALALKAQVKVRELN